MPPKTPFQSSPTVQSVDANTRRIAARVAGIEAELSGENPDSQLTKVWESIEELNLRVLFLMETLRITQVMSPIAGVNGQQPKRTIPALEAYMVGFGEGAPSGRDLLVARIQQQYEAAQKSQEAQSGESVPAIGGEDEDQTGAAQPDSGETAGQPQAADEGTDAASKPVDDAPTLVNNVSRFKKH
jgi:hypothetical protein